MSKRKRHNPEQIVRKLQEVDCLLNAGQSLSYVLQMLAISKSTFHRWRNLYGGMMAESGKHYSERGGRYLAGSALAVVSTQKPQLTAKAATV